MLSWIAPAGSSGLCSIVKGAVGFVVGYGFARLVSAIIAASYLGGGKK